MFKNCVSIWQRCLWRIVFTNYLSDCFWKVKYLIWSQLLLKMVKNISLQDKPVVIGLSITKIISEVKVLRFFYKKTSFQNNITLYLTIVNFQLNLLFLMFFQTTTKLYSITRKEKTRIFRNKLWSELPH